VLFVLKQPNSNELLGEDYRDYGPDVCFPNQVWSQLLARLHGIMQATQGHFLPYEEAIRPASLETAWHQYPFAAINLNKEEGAGTTNPTDLQSYVKSHADFIRQQIQILRPDIIVCCGQPIFTLLNTLLLPATEETGAWVKPNPALGITYIDTWHPGKPMGGARLKEAYEKPLGEMNH
jgi:hypothetical protein